MNTRATPPLAETRETLDDALIKRIIERAKESNYGLHDEGKSPLTFEQYAQQDFDSLALILVNAFESKYDLVSIFRAAMQEIHATTLEHFAQMQGNVGELENHCADCCCAQSWKALGVTQYDGKSIPEHIVELEKDRKRLNALMNHINRIGYHNTLWDITFKLRDICISDIDDIIKESKEFDAAIQASKEGK